MVAFNLSDSPESSTAKKSRGKAEEDFVEASTAPDWLPEGWVMELKCPTSGTKMGTTIKRFIDRSTGRKFHSKPQVFEYLKSASPYTCSDDQKMIVVHPKENNQVEANHASEECWLPNGWTETHKILHTGRKYKLFVAPAGEKFYSKPEVLRYLQKMKDDKSSSNQQDFIARGNSNENIDHSPAGGGASECNVSRDVKDNKNDASAVKAEQRDLPPGWVSELRTKGGRRDWYFTDPVSGLIFRSRKDVFRYLETGDVNKCATRPKMSSNNDSQIIIANLPPSSAKLQESSDRTVRQHLFAGNGKSSVTNSAVFNAEGSKDSRVTRASSKTAATDTPTTEGKKSRQSSSISPLVIEEASSKRVTRASAKPEHVSSPANESPKEKTPSKPTAQSKKHLELRNLMSTNIGGYTTTRRVTRGYSKQVSPSTELSMDHVASDKEETPNSDGGSMKRVTRGSAKTNGIDIESNGLDPPNSEDSARKRFTRGSARTIATDIESSKDDSPNFKDTSIKRVTRGSAKANGIDIEVGVNFEPLCSVVSPVKDLKRKHGKMVDATAENDADTTNYSPSSVKDSKTKIAKKDSAQNGTKERITKKNRPNTEDLKNQEERNATRRSSRRHAATASKPLVNISLEAQIQTPRAIAREENAGDIVALNKIVDSVAQWASQQLAAIPELARKSSSVVPVDMNNVEPSYKSSIPYENLTDPKLFGCLDAEEKYQNDVEKLQSAHPGNQTDPKETCTEYLQSEKNDYSNQESQPSFVFGDSWADPCLEFAYKTLTGDLPMENNPDIQNYYQPQRDAPVPMEIDDGLLVPKIQIPKNTFALDDSTSSDAPVTPVFGQRSRAFFPSIDVNVPFDPQESSFDERNKNRKQV